LILVNCHWPTFVGGQIMYHDPGFENIFQVAIICRDIEATSKRWAALLGVEVPKNFTTEPGTQRQMTFRGKPSDAQCKLAFIKRGDCTIELIQPLGGDSSWQEGLDQHGQSIHHIAFRVKDLENTLKACAELGFPQFHRGRFGGNDGTFAYVDSQEQLGATIELLSFDKDAKKV
jgi:catechol 2,3-dioxygenase-like lactoylglutathione lyase family enzyme